MSRFSSSWPVIQVLLCIVCLQKCRVEPESSWSVALADYIRNNDQSLQEASSKVLAMFQDELLPSETFAEFCDVTGTTKTHFTPL